MEFGKAGKDYIEQSVNLTAVGTAIGRNRGSLGGALDGLLFFNPLAGMAIRAITGAGTGALAGSLTDYGIPDDFVNLGAGRLWRTVGLPTKLRRHCNQVAHFSVAAMRLAALAGGWS